jgi:AcrR family transcriptional regulator
VAELTETLARRAAERAIAGRQAEIAGEMRRIVDRTMALIERTGTVNPPLREILAETGLSTQAFYRHFRSKDEVLLVLLDDGRRQLVSYLEHRMATVDEPRQKIGEWVRGVLAQGTNETAASRTRPFVASEDRLAQAFSAEHAASVDLLIDLLVTVIADQMGRGDADARADAAAVYELAFGRLRHHLVRGTRPTDQEIDHLVLFSLGGIGQAGNGAADPSNGASGECVT